jgi:predicted nucleotide-binding protein
MVVHGRNLRARDGIFTFLRALGLRPIEWEEAVAETGVASPHNLDAVRAAMDVAQAVVVVLTAEDRAGLLPQLADADDDDVMLRGQPRQNVILEGGLAMGVDRSRVVLVEIGSIRRASDFDGLNVVRLTNAAPTRLALRSRLQSAGCEIDEALTDWARPEAGGDFDAAVVMWSPTRVNGGDGE